MELNPREFHKLLAPRVTVLVTYVDAKGFADVAPFSFVTPISFNPPLLLLGVGMNKHSYWSIIQKKEFVVNIPTEEMLEKIWVAGGRYDPEISKIQRAGLGTKPAKIVAPPLLSECVANIECYLEEAKKFGDHIAIVGRVVAIHVKDEYIDEKNRLRVDLARPPLHIADNVFAFPYVIKKVEE